MDQAGFVSKIIEQQLRVNLDMLSDTLFECVKLDYVQNVQN